MREGRATLPGRERTREAVPDLLLLAGSWTDASEQSVHAHRTAP